MKTRILILLFLLVSCKELPAPATQSNVESAGTACADIESQMSTLLAATNTQDNLPYTYVIERLSDNRRYVYSKAGVDADTVYESASTSKFVTGVIILRAVENGDLSLTDNPQTYIGTWPIGNTDSLYPMTLSHLLSFRSGLVTEPPCINIGFSNFSTCVNTMGSTNDQGVLIPGNEFYYSGNHLQVAGQMAVNAKSMANWQDVFAEFQTQTGLFPTSTYDLPSATNPRLAGGMQWR